MNFYHHQAEELTLLPNSICVPTITHVVSHPIVHKLGMLEKWLPSIKMDLIVSLHVEHIKGFIENWSLVTQRPWVLHVVQGFQLLMADHPT